MPPPADDSLAELERAHAGLDAMARELARLTEQLRAHQKVVRALDETHRRAQRGAPIPWWLPSLFGTALGLTVTYLLNHRRRRD